MGLLDQVIGNVLGGMLGGGHAQRDAPQGGGHGGGLGGGMGGGLGGSLGGALGGGATSPIVQAILMLLLSRGGGALGDVLGDVLGGGHRPGPQGPRGGSPDDETGPGTGEDERQPGPGGPFGDIFGRRQGGGGGGGDFGDLAGQLDPQGGRNAGAGSYGEPNRGPDEAAHADNGLGGLLERFQRGGYGDVLESWIGGGQNRPIAPNQLADALGTDTVDTLAQRTGLGRDALLSGLAQALPGVVDALTPHGRLPNQDERRAW